jgi:hypothetical protein
MKIIFGYPIYWGRIKIQFPTIRNNKNIITPNEGIKKRRLTRARLAQLFFRASSSNDCRRSSLSSCRWGPLPLGKPSAQSVTTTAIRCACASIHNAMRPLSSPA